MPSPKNTEASSGQDPEASSLVRQSFIRVLPSALAIVPVSMLFGVLAYRADWSVFEILAVGLLGFTGSGQFAVLPLAQANTNFLTILIICASINCRYFPIALTTSKRLPKPFIPRILVSHTLGDEAYATEKNSDTVRETVCIRLTIFTLWVVSGGLGAVIAQSIPHTWLSTDIHLGFPASVVLVYLSALQLKTRIVGVYRKRIAMIVACLILAIAFYSLLGAIYFWLPSVAMTALLLDKWTARE